ncbi:MAG: hypothetical protein COA43_04845 [Robiginitomaculum sp.]|nr:MAG: hypothetical protein COA43_04845 [Robiginitomaculum sp.]
MTKLTDSFYQNADGSDLNITTDASKLLEREALLMGMGDGEALIDSGTMAKNNAASNLAINTETKKRNKDAIDRALLESITRTLNGIETEMKGLEVKIANSREIIADNNSDIDFIRTLDTDNLYDANGDLRGDVTTFLKKHGYDDLDDKSEDDLRHIITAIEVQAIEQNDIEASNIEGWLERHGQLRQQAVGAAQDGSADQKQRASDLAGRDPEQLARDRLDAMVENKSDIADSSKNLETVAETQVMSTEFGFS